VIPRQFLHLNFVDVSPHNFSYLLEPSFDSRCISGGSDNRKSIMARRHFRPLLTVILVHSSANHFAHRSTIRHTWGSVGKRVSKIVFLLGDPHNETLQEKLLEENRLHSDILQESFHETYRNITLKAVMGMKWVTEKCPETKFVCKSDDDMFVKIGRVYNALQLVTTPKNDFLLCRITVDSPVLREGKYAVSPTLYNETTWPPFCFGGFWIASSDVIKRLYRQSLSTPQLHLDDVYVTGILREKLGISLRRVSRLSMLFCHGVGRPENVEEMWRSRDSADGSVMLNNTNVQFLQCG